jgi:hypothetical protein
MKHQTKAQERRNAQTAKTRALRHANLPTGKKTNECVCGCGTKVRLLFAQGHDQRVRGMLQRIAAGTEKPNPTLAKALREGLVVGEVKEANQPIVHNGHTKGRRKAA